MSATARFYRDAGAERWGVTPETFAAALERSSAKAFAGRTPTSSDLDKYYGALHLADLALACACSEGNEAAWDHFVSEFRPALYRAADAIDRTGTAREIADSLYGELFSRSLFKYFHGRSTLTTWLRSLLSQRYVDRLRETRRLDPLPDEEGADSSGMARAVRRSPPGEGGSAEADRGRFAAAMQAVLAAAIAVLEPRDRLRLRCYYAERATLAQIGRITGESEATVSRQLARTRKVMREQIETRLQREHRFSADEARDCIASAMDDAGTLDLGQLLVLGAPKPKGADGLVAPKPKGAGGRKKNDVDRSTVEDAS